MSGGLHQPPLAALVYRLTAFIAPSFDNSVCLVTGHFVLYNSKFVDLFILNHVKGLVKSLRKDTALNFLYTLDGS
jgi:hypothetical protein